MEIQAVGVDARFWPFSTDRMANGGGLVSGYHPPAGRMGHQSTLRASIASTARINTFTPFVMSAEAVYSCGEWLIPPTLGTKIIPMEAMRAMSWASCPAPLGMAIVVSPVPCA